MANLINQEAVSRFEDVRNNHKYCDTALAERKMKILQLCNKHSIAFGKCYLQNTELWKPCAEINNLIVKTEELLSSAIFENCGSNIYQCIDIIDQIICNTEKQLQLVRKVREDPENELAFKDLNAYEVILEHDKEALKLFRQSASKFTDLV